MGRRAVHSAAFGVLAVVVSGCVGAIDRSEFEGEIEQRGGGFDQALVLDAVEAIASEVGTDEFEITNLNVSPITPTLSVRVRDPRAPDQLDDYTFRGDELVDVRPVRVSAGTDLAAQALPIGEFALERLDDVVDEALAAFATPGGFATNVQLSTRPDLEGGAPDGEVVVQVESPRSAATVRFTADGELVGVDPS